MTTLSQAKQQLLKAGFDCQGDGGGGYEIYQAQIRIGRVYSDQELIGWQPPTVLVGIPMMDQAEARATVEAIKGHMDSARKLLLDLHEREGWRALGYTSWHACAKAEFGSSTATLYRQLEAAEIERDVRGDSQLENQPPIPTTQLQVVKALPPAIRKDVFDRATEIAGDRPRTAKDVQAAVAEIKPQALSTEEQKHAKEVRALLKELPVWHESIQPQVIKDAYKHVCKIRGGALRDSLIAEIAAAEQSLSTDVQQPPEPTTDDRRPNDRTAYEARETADQVLLDDARAAITEGCYADARALLAGIEVKTVARDLVRAQLITAAAQRFMDDQRTRLARYSPAALVSQADHKLALDHIAALLDLEAAQ